MATPTRRSSRIPTGVVAVIVFLVALVALLLLFGDGEDPRTLLVEYAPRSVEESVADGLTPVELRPSSRLRVTGRRVRWLDESGRPFVETPRVVFMVTLGTGPDGGVLVSDGVIDEPVVHLVQTGPDRWNYERPLAPLLDGGDDGGDGGALAFRMRDIGVTGGHVILDLLEARYEARSLVAHLASAQLTGPGLDAPIFQVARARGDLVLPDTADGTVVRPVTVADATIRMLDGIMAFDVASGTFGQSRLAAVQGTWTPGGEGLGLDLRATVAEARVADLPWLPGAVPEGAGGRFALRVEPRPGGRSAISLSELDVRAPGSSATGFVRFVIGGVRPQLEAVDVRVDPLSVDLVEAFTGPLPYGGTVTGTIRGADGDIRLDLRGQLTTPAVSDPFTTDLVGRVALTEEGITVRDADVTFDRLPLSALDQIVPGLPFGGAVSGTVSLTGEPGAGPVRLDLRIEAGGGIITVGGVADLTAPVPTYDLSGRIAGVRANAVLRIPAPPAEVHAGFQLAGRGTDPRTAEATLVANGTFTGWTSEPGDTLAVRAGIAGGAVDVRALRLELGPISLAGGGVWDYVRGSGTIEYRLAVEDIGPLEPYLPADSVGRRRFARGSLRADGTASGTLDAPILAGVIGADEFRWGPWATERLAADYRVNISDGLPLVEAELSADEIRSPFGAFAAVEATVDFGRPAFAVDIRADQPQDRGIVHIQADGLIDETGRREIHVRSMEVDLQQQRWALPEPATVAWTAGETVRIEGLVLRQADAEGRIMVDGTLAPIDQLDVAVDVTRLPVGDVLVLMGSDLEIAGDLSVVGRVAGPGDAPDLDVDLTLTDGSFRGVAIRSLVTEVTYDGARLRVDGEGLLGDSARIQLTGTVPARLQLSGAPLFSLIDDGAIDLQIITRTFPLATLDPGLASAEDLEGRLEANLRLGGTPAEPRLSGSGQLLDGAVTIPMLDRRFGNIRGAFILTGREARLRELVVESDGFARVQGTLDFVELTNPALSLEARLERFRFQDVPNETDAALWGTLSLRGTAADPVLTGSIRADDGAVSLAPLQQPDLSARLADGRELDLIDPAFDSEFGGPTESGGIRIDNLRVQAGQDLWVHVTDDARLRLNGNLTVNGTGQTVAIQGTLQGEGGTFQLRAGVITRQFQIVSSEVRFFGTPDPDPRIDIVASRVIRMQDGADVDVRIQVTGTLNNPSLALATAAGPEVPESELLSFLLFGRPTTDLGQITGDGFEGALGQGLAYTGVIEGLTSGLSEEIGALDYFRVEYLPGVGLFATAGVEVASDLFVNADLPLERTFDASAIGLEWRAGEFGILRGAYEPVQRQDRLVGTRGLTFLENELKRQWIVAWRKRWTY